MSANQAGEQRRRPPQIFTASASFVIAAGLVLAGCVSSSPPNPDTRLPATYSVSIDAATSDVVLDRWWIAFGDRQLTALVEKALDKALDARTAQAVLDEARANRRGQVRQLYIPSTPLKGSASRKRTEILDSSGGTSLTQGGETDSYAANFDVSWELDLWGRRRAARGVVENDLAAARFAFEGSRAALAASVAEAYFQAKSLAMQLEDAQQSARLNGALRDFSVKKAKAGLAATSEADRAEADQAQSLAMIADLEAQLAGARRNLLILIGSGIEPLDALPIAPSLDPPPPIPLSVPSDLMSRRPDVREARAKLASAVGTLKIDELDLLPTFTLTPGLGWSKSVAPGYSFLGQSGRTSTTTGTRTLGGSVSIPLLNIPYLLTQIDAQDARTRRAAIAYEKAVQTAYGETENAMMQLAADQKRVALLTAGEARAERAYAASRRGYGLGLNDLTSTVQAEQAWRSARTALTNAKTQALLQTVKTYKALGGGWSPMVAPIEMSAK